MSFWTMGGAGMRVPSRAVKDVIVTTGKTDVDLVRCSVEPVLKSQAGNQFEVLAVRPEEKCVAGDRDRCGLEVHRADADSRSFQADGFFDRALVQQCDVETAEEREQLRQLAVGVDLAGEILFLRDGGEQPRIDSSTLTTVVPMGPSVSVAAPNRSARRFARGLSRNLRIER
ncbi:MAG: hypothetical protein U0791_01555 [Gemmataceae bacterium]